MSVTKIIVSVVLLAFILFLGSQIYVFIGKRNTLYDEREGVEQALDDATRVHESLGEEFEYLSRPENLEKELRARFNLKSFGETTLILVPGTASSTSDGGE